VEDLIRQIRAANSGGLYYLALFAALALPDICGALEATDGTATSDRYKDWFDQHVASKYKGVLDGKTCWQFRCSMLHQGSTQHSASRYSRIFFVEPGASSLIFNKIVFSTPAGTALNIDVTLFCENMVSGVEAWLLKARQLPQVATNLSKSVTRHRLEFHLSLACL
jgi:hypothetical protein